MSIEILEEKPAAGTVLVCLKGRLDPSTTTAAESRLMAVAAGGGHLVLDLAALDYVSSAGLRVILMVGKKIRAGKGQLVLCSAGKYVKEVFDISGFSSVFPMCGTRDEALASLSPDDLDEA